MRIGLLALEVTHSPAVTGQYICALIQAFISTNDPPELVVFVRESDLPFFAFTGLRVELVVVPDSHLPHDPAAHWQESRLPDLVREARVDLVHAPLRERLVRLDTCPLVATVHDAQPLRAAKKLDFRLRFFDRYMARKLAREYRAMIATTECAARDLRELLEIPEELITVIPEGIDHERFHPRPAYEAKLEIDQRFDLQDPFFLYPAPLRHPEENHLRLIEAFNRFKARTKSSWLLALAGGDGPGANLVHAAIRESPFVADIRPLGTIADFDVASLYQAADALVLPALGSGPNQAPLEAMACGCPVLSSMRGALGELVGEAASRLDPEDVVDVAEKMAAMAGSLELRNRWRAAGLARAKKFDWRFAVQDTLEVYERVLNRQLVR